VCAYHAPHADAQQRRVDEHALVREQPVAQRKRDAADHRRRRGAVADPERLYRIPTLRLRHVARTAR
jgi:hypothetical protein